MTTDDDQQLSGHLSLTALRLDAIAPALDEQANVPTSDFPADIDQPTAYLRASAEQAPNQRT